MSLGGGGGGGGQRPLEQEERDLLTTQRQVAQQGIRGRDLANAGYEQFVSRGRDMGSIANQNFQADQAATDATAAYGNAQRIRDTQLMSMGVNPGDPRFTRGRDTAGVGLAAQVASAENQARAGVRQQGLSLEGAGLTGLAGNDPTGALSSMGSTISGAQNRALQSQQATAAGYGALGQGALYGLKNYDSIAKGAGELWDTVGGWFGAADGGLMTPAGVMHFTEGGGVPPMMGVHRYANGGNVYDRAQGEIGGAVQSMPARPNMPAQQPQGPGLGGYMQAYNLANKLVEGTASGIGLTGTAGAGTSLASTGANLASMGGAQGLSGAAFGGELGASAAALGGEAAAGAGAGALGTLGAAMPWLGGALLVGGLLDDLFADGGAVRPRIGVAPRTMGGRTMNPAGGAVRGPGGPKDDKIPAWLSSGEFVMPVGAVKKFGIDRLEKMRQAGLEFEQQNGIGNGQDQGDQA